MSVFLQAKESNTGIEAQSALALRLLGVLLQRAEHGTILADNAVNVAAAVPSVASFMVLGTRSASSAAAAAEMGKQPEPGQAPAPPAPDILDPAALQLEALHVLLLILSSPPPQVCLDQSSRKHSPPSVAGLCAHMSTHLDGSQLVWLPSLRALVQVEECLLASSKDAAKFGTGWSLQARSGIATLLRGRLAPAQRQAALQVAASILDLVGPDWLLAPSHDGVRSCLGASVSSNNY